MVVVVGVRGEGGRRKKGGHWGVRLCNSAGGSGQQVGILVEAGQSQSLLESLEGRCSSRPDLLRNCNQTPHCLLSRWNPDLRCHLDRRNLFVRNRTGTVGGCMSNPVRHRCQP